MADTAARLAISARRNEVARFTIAVTGIDMTGVAMAMQIRLGRDVPGAPLIALATVGTLAAEGLKLDGVTVTNGVPTSIIKGRINASTMTDATMVPYAGEMGDNTTLAYAMQWTLNGDAQTRLYGDFVVLGSAFGSDNAPTNRPQSYATSSTSGGSSGGSLTFGDQLVQVSISGIEQVAALIGLAKVEADRAKTEADRAAQQVATGTAQAVALAGAEATKAVTARQASEAAAIISGRSRDGSVAALAQVTTARDGALQSISTAQATLLAKGFYQTTAQGLAAVAEGESFSVFGAGAVYAQRYTKTNGAAVAVAGSILPSQAAVDRIGRFVPAQAQGDNALSINQALNDPLVRGVYLPSGNTMIDTTIIPPDGKFVHSAGRGVATITRRNSNFEGGNNGALIRTAVGARGVHVRGLTLVAPKSATKVTGVWMQGSIDAVVEEVDCYNMGYSFFMQEYARGNLVRRSRSFNANVDFETTQAYDGVFEDCERSEGDGDNPLGSEAWCHGLLGSRGITWRRIKGTGKGQPVLMVANDVNGDPLGGLIDRMVIDDCDFDNQFGQTCYYFISYNGLQIGSVLIRNTRLSGSGIACIAERGDITLEGGSIRTGSQEVILASAGTSILSKGLDVFVDSPQGASGYVYNATNAPITVVGGSVTTTSSTIDMGLGGANLSVSRETRFIGPRKIYGPSGIGQAMRYIYPADVAQSDQTTPVGAGTNMPVLLFGVAPGRRYRVRFRGSIKKTGTDGTLRLQVDPSLGPIASLGYGHTRIRDVNGNISENLSVAELYAIPVDTIAQFEMDITILGNDSTFVVNFGHNGATIMAGAELIVECVA